MEIKFFCPLWGSENLTFGEFLAKVKAAGFDGVEFSLSLEQSAKTKLLNEVRMSGLLLIGQHWETATSDFSEYKKQYLSRLYDQVEGKPIMINSQTGKDFFSFDQNSELIRVASDFSEKTGIPVVHELHRGKFSFAAHITRNFFKAFPGLRVCADFSHWCTVAETLLEDQEEAVDLAIERADHIHARVGYHEGPQIPDPRASEWKEIVEMHIGWWERIILRAAGEDREYFTVTPEFGPFPYMIPLPHSQEPIADQWDVNVYMMGLLKERFGKL